MSGSQTEIAHITLVGDRAENQDRALILEDTDCCLLALGDGLGGHPQGDVAAQILMDTCARLWSEAHKPLLNPSYFLQQCMLQAHRAIVSYGAAQVPPVSPRTTAVLALLQEGECYWSHAGDSRFYLVREEAVHRVSRDHVVANDASGLYSPGENPAAITRCLGGSARSIAPALGAPVALRAGDVVLLCSDGFWNQLDETQMLTVLHNALPLENALGILGEMAVENRSGQSDNVTAVGIRLGHDSFGVGRHPLLEDEESELLMAIEHLNRLIEKTL